MIVDRYNSVYIYNVYINLFILVYIIEISLDKTRQEEDLIRTVTAHCTHTHIYIYIVSIYSIYI